MKYNTTEYSIKVWLTSVVIGPFLLMILSWLVNHKLSVEGLDVVILMGALFSLPSLLVFYLICKYITKRVSNMAVIKVYITIIGILLTYIPFLIIDDYHFLLDVDQLSRYFFPSYSIVIVAAVWIYKLKIVDSEPFEERISGGL
jgi:hypothetical protein